MCFFFITYYPRYKQLDKPIVVFQEEEEGDRQDVWCVSRPVMVNKTVYEEMEGYAEPLRKAC